MKNLFLIMVSFMFYSCAPKAQDGSSDNCSYQDESENRLVVIGDSHGYGIAKADCFSHYGYAMGISQAMDLKLDDYAISGSKIDSHIAQIPQANIKPGDRVVYLMGYNDMYFNGTDYLDTYKAKLEQALTLLDQTGAKVYIGGLLPDLQDLNQSQAYAQAIAEVSSHHPNLIYIDVFHDFNNDASFYLDGIHLNKTGADVLAELFLNKME